MNKRRAKLYRHGPSLVVTVPRDFVRGNGLQPGDDVEVLYNGILEIRILPGPRPAGVRREGNAATAGAKQEG